MATNTRSLKLPVGRNGINTAQDVRVIQQLLNTALKAEPKLQQAGIAPLAEDSDCGSLTVKAIETYQENVLGWSGPAVDGTVHPDRATWRSLNGNVRSISQIKAQQVTVAPEIVAGFNVFRQGNSQWGTEHLGEGTSTIWGAGCALCTLTMAATVLGSPTIFWPKDLLPKNLTPLLANIILRKAGAFSGSGLVMLKAPEALGMSCYQRGKDEVTKPEDVSTISSAIQSGYAVAAQVDYKDSKQGDHWILIVRKYSDNTYGAIDPTYGREVSLTPQPISGVGGQKFTRTENIKRGVLYGFGMGQEQYVVVRFIVLKPFSSPYFRLTA